MSIFLEEYPGSLVADLKPVAFLVRIKCQRCNHIETSQLICNANRLTGFYMMASLTFNELKLTPSQLTSSLL